MSGQNREIYGFDEFQLDIGKGVLLREGKLVCLQWKTFETLCALVRSKGQLVTLDELMNALWNDTFVEENNLRQHISALRKALGEKEKQTIFIETVPRRGYRFLPEVRIVDSGESKILPPNNLSIQSAAIIGREKEIAEILNLLRREDVRILTLTGVGGTGKTTLAQAAAREILADFKDGAFFVELAAVTNPELVASTIAQTLGLKETGGKPILEVLKEYLREKQILIVADNFEQILSAAPALAEAVKSAPDLKILVTSRARLQLRETHEFTVPPLAVPESAAQVSLDELAENESVRLFTERARTVNSKFSLAEENAGSVAEICRRLDGLPLAIELAAARVRIIPPRSILEKLENRLRLLTGGARDLPARQQTVRGTVEWSYELLDEDEKRLFRRLAVFAGGFTFDAAEAVCGDNESNEDRIKVLDAVTSLLDKSLLVQKEQTNGEPRFRMLEVVREYALESLEASGEAENMRRRHAAYFLALTEKAEPELQSVNVKEWIDRLEQEHDNLSEALRWSMDFDEETALNLTGNLWLFWQIHGHLMEARSWSLSALKKCSDIYAPARRKTLYGAGLTIWIQGDFQMARQLFEECLKLSRLADDKRYCAFSTRGLGMVAYVQDNITKAKALYEECLSIARDLDDKLVIGLTLNSLGELARSQGKFTAARRFYEDAIAALKSIGNKEVLLHILCNLGAVVCVEGDEEGARPYFAEVLQTGLEFGNKSVMFSALEGFAMYFVKRGESARSAKLAGAAANLLEALGIQIEAADLQFRDTYLAELHALLSEADFNEFYEQGRKLKLEEAVKLALEE